MSLTAQAFDAAVTVTTGDDMNFKQKPVVGLHDNQRCIIDKPRFKAASWVDPILVTDRLGIMCVSERL